MTSSPPDSNLPVAKAELVAHRLVALRDALVMVSQALRDYQFLLESTERRAAMLQADHLLNRIRARDRLSD
jgi:hypothetical protein